MKTKLIFATMVLPALFAACTADEMVENSSANLQGRALLDPITVNVVGGNADTRFSWNEGNFGWNGFTAEDKFSAGLVDDADGTIQDKVLTNYVFSSQDGANYTTTSQMVEGAYFFYSYPGFESSSARKEVAFDLTSQVKVDLNNPTATVEENQLFVTPLYKLTKESANEALGLEFISYWSTAAIAVKNTSDQSFKIVRVLLKAGGDEKFLVKGKLSPEAMEDAGLVYSYEDGQYVLPDGASKDDLRTANIAAADGKTEVSELFVDCQSYEVAAGAKATIYVQVPAKIYEEDMEVEIVAEVADGNDASLKTIKGAVVKNTIKNPEAAENDAVKFSRGKTTAVFGIENGAPKALEIDDITLIKADNADGKYASSYDDVYGYLTDKTVGGEVSVYNLGTLKLDDKLMALVKRMMIQVTFLNTIEIESVNSATLDYVTLNEGATIIGGEITVGSKVELPVGKSLVIGEEASAIVATVHENFKGNIKNNGTLKMNGTNAPKIVNGDNATIQIVGNQNWKAAASYPMAKNLIVNEGVGLTVGENILTVAYGQTLTNNGTITAAAVANLVNHGKIVNNGAITNVTNQSTRNSADTADLQAVIENYGSIAKVDNKANNSAALIKMMSGDAEVKATTADEAGIIDNTIGGLVTGAQANIVKAVYEGNQSGKLGNVMAVTLIEVKNGTWTNPSIPNAANLTMENVTLSASAAITLDAQTTVTAKNISANKALTLGGTTVEISSSTLTNDVTLDDATTADLTSVTFNGP